MILQGGFVVLGIIFGCDNHRYNSSPVWELSLLAQFSGITILQALSFGETVQGGFTNHDLVYEE